MALRIVGAGVGRTGTASLKQALEQLLDGPCFHMAELFEHPELTPTVHAAARGEDIDWASFPPGYVATVDWPACAFWRQLADASPGAPVLLSSRESSEKWWESYSQTILRAMTAPVPPEDTDWMARRALMSDLMPNTFSPDWKTREGAIAGYERHNAAVREAIPAERLIDWRPGDGWEPICEKLGVAVPDEPFPHTNTTQQFREASDAVE
jgi:hypothetical protein